MFARPLSRLALLMAAIRAALPAAHAAPSIWQAVGPTAPSYSAAPSAVAPPYGAGTQWVHPTQFQEYRLDVAALRALLAAAPLEQPAAAHQTGVIVPIPMPNGTLARFNVVESPIMAPALAAKYPGIHTYAGQGIDDPSASVRFDDTPLGFHFQALSPAAAAYADPLFRGDTTLYAAYDHAHASPTEWSCNVTKTANALSAASHARAPRNLSTGPQYRTYRMAMGTTYEYTQTVGGTKTAAMSAIVAAVNRMDQIYDLEADVKFVLVANTDALISLTPGEYTNSDNVKMLDENQARCDTLIGDANYDIGHVLTTCPNGGIAATPSVCMSGQKAQGNSGFSNPPLGDPLWVDFLCHEVGHQFSGTHGFNSTSGGCGPRQAETAYEPGSGSTIMCYSGTCAAPDNVVGNSLPYFNTAALDEIYTYIADPEGGGACAVVSATGNHPPTVDAGPTYTLPIGTPFRLTAAGSDPDGDRVYYCWEERDLGPAQALADPDNGQSPLFRSFPGTLTPTRTFPQLSDILNGTQTKGEKLPMLARTLKMRVTARDNRIGGGGVSSADQQYTVTAAAGPFNVTAPAANAIWPAGSTQIVTWDVANTNGAPVDAAKVNILMSTDYGQTFPITLAANTDNDGSESIVMPAVDSVSARIEVEAVGNVFFNVSPAFATRAAQPMDTVVRALRIVAGLQIATQADVANLDTEGFVGPIELVDAVRAARKAAGLDQ